MKYKHIYLLLVTTMILISCWKESPVENTQVNTSATPVASEESRDYESSPIGGGWDTENLQNDSFR